jgi:hypothetical protein
LLVDLYHLMEEDEPLATIDDYADLLVHAHVADSERRHPGTGTYPIAPFFAQQQERLHRQMFDRMPLDRLRRRDRRGDGGAAGAVV